MSEDAPKAHSNGNGNGKYISSVLSAAIAIAGTLLGTFGWQLMQATWNAATLMAKMDSRIENVETGLRAVKTETAEIKLLLQPTNAVAQTQPKRIVIRSKDRP